MTDSIGHAKAGKHENKSNKHDFASLHVCVHVSFVIRGSQP